MAKVRINKLPEGYKLNNGKLVESKNMGGATRSGDQKDYGLISHPAEYHHGVSPFNPFSEVNNSLKAMPKEESSIEAEGGETTLTDLNEDGKFELYNIVGPRHSNGGVPLNLPPQSFIYSDTRGMLFNDDEMLEMGIKSKKKLTPAKISKKYPLNEYIGIMDNITSDKIAIDTAEYMTDKNKKKLSQLAFIQEAKKGFEEGVPAAAFPYLKLQGLDPIQFTQQIEGINEQEAKQKALAQMPLDQRQQIMALQGILQQVQQQDFQEAQQAKPAPQLPANQQMAVAQQGMPPQQGIMPPQGPPMEMPMQPPMAEAPMPMMRYGGEYQRGGAHEVDLNVFSLGECVGAGTCPQYRGGGKETELAAFLGAEGTNEDNALLQAGIKAGLGSRGRSGFGVGLSGEAGMQTNMKDVLNSNMDPMAFYKSKLKAGYADAPLYINKSQYPGANLGAYGEYDSNSGMNVGLEGGVGPVSLRGGYNVDTKSPFLGAGLKINLQDGGDFSEEDLSNLMIDYGYEGNVEEFVDDNYGIVDHLTDEDVEEGRDIGDRAKVNIADYIAKLEENGFTLNEKSIDEDGNEQSKLMALIKKKMEDDKGGRWKNPSYDEWDQEAWDHILNIKNEYGDEALMWIANNFTDKGLNDAFEDQMGTWAKIAYSIGKDRPIDTLENILDFDLDEYREEDAKNRQKKYFQNFRKEQYGGPIPSEYLYGGALPKAGWGTGLDWLQGGLSVVGMVPGLGIVADAANTAISGGRAAYAGYTGDTAGQNKYLADMALNATAMIPGVGQVATATKGAKGLKNVATAAGTKIASDTANYAGDAAGWMSKYTKKAKQVGDITKGGMDTVTGGAQALNLTKKADFVTGSHGKDAIKDTVYEASKDKPASEGPGVATQEPAINETLAQNTTTPTATTTPTTAPTTASAPTTPTTTTASAPPPAEPAIAEAAPQSGGGREEYVPQSQRGKYGGDPFANNALKEFVYGSAQDGKEIPEGWTDEAFKKATENGFVYNSEDGTWSHPTYTEGNTNYYLNQIKDDYDISGVSEGIGEEGIPGLQQSGETKGGTKVYQDINDDQVQRWQEANNYIISGLKDENGDPLFTEDNPFTPTQENIKLVQQGKNDYLDRLLETDPSIKENYIDDDGNFNQEAYYKDYHGYYGDGTQAIDGKLGEYTVSDLGMQKQPSDPPEVTINEPDPADPEPIEPGEVTTTTETERPEFWLQDQIKYTDLVRQKLGLRKYRPWAATFSPETLDATIVDPGRAIAAIQEGAKTAGDSTVFAGPAANRAMKLKAQGQAAKSVSDIWAQNQEANLRSVAETNKINTLIKNEAAEKNLTIKNTLFKDNIAVDKEYDNSLRDINNKLANQLANSYTNMANTENLNSLYPQFDIDQGSGGFVDFTNPQELFANKNTDDRSKTEKLADTIAELKQNNIDPKTLPKEVWNDLLADSTGGGGNSELDEVKQAITQGGYGGVGQTGMLGGYPGNEQARYGGEKAKRLAKKGRELRQWFSPLQRGMAD